MTPELARVARRQGGCFTLAQAQRHGLPESTLRRMVERGRLARILPRVYASATTPVTPLLRAHAAVLSYGRPCALSHESAAWLWSLRPAPGVITISVPHSRSAGSPPSWLRVVRTTGVKPSRRDGLPVVSLARMLVDLCQVWSEREVTALALQLIQVRRTTRAAIAAALVQLGDRKGTAMCRRVLVELDPMIESYLSAELLTLVIRADVAIVKPSLGRTVVIATGYAVPDVALDDLMLAFEADGLAHHTGLSMWRAIVGVTQACVRSDGRLSASSRMRSVAIPKA